MTDQQPISPADADVLVIECPRISRWVWRPWYAKLWWASIATYWTIGVGALWFRLLAEFYGSNLAGYLNIVLYPVFALFILSIGWMIAWKDALDYAATHPEIENNLGWHWSTEPYKILDDGAHRSSDPTDPTSPIFIANANRHLLGR